MAIIGILIVGLLVGIVAKFLMPGKDPGGFVVTSLLGVAGSLVAYYLGSTLGWYLPGEPVGFLASVIGAMILLVIYRLARRRKGY